MTSPRPQPNVRDETNEYEEMQRELRPAYTAEHRTMYSPSAEHRTIYSPSTSTPSTVRSVSREQVDRESASANMAAMRPSIMGVPTEEQKQARDRHRMNRTLFGNYLIDAQEEQQFRREMSAIASSTRTAYKEPSFDGHQAMPAIIAQDNVMYDNQSTPLTQKGGGEKISAFTQTEKIFMVEISMQTVVEMSTQTDEEKVSAALSNFVPTQVEDWEEIMVAQSGEMIDPNQESTISIQTIPISNEIRRTTIQQEGQLIIFADATSYEEDYQNQHQETPAYNHWRKSNRQWRDRLRRVARPLF